jgi:putative sterol carrier protein
MSNPEIEQLMLSIPGRLPMESLEGINAAIQFEFDSENSESWLLTIRDEKSEMKRGRVNKPDAIFMAGTEDFLVMLSGDIEKIGWSFLQGKIVVEGDMTIIWRVLAQLRST